MSSSSKIKGSRVEREIVELHKAAGIDCSKVPLSGALGGEFSGDIKMNLAGEIVKAEVKARKNGAGFATIEKWLGANQILFLRRDRQQPLVLLPWTTYERLLKALADKSSCPTCGD